MLYKGHIFSHWIHHPKIQNYCCLGFGCRRQKKIHAAAPPPTSVRRRMERNRQKLVSQDKGSLTEQKKKGKRNKKGTNKEKKQKWTARLRQPLSRTGPVPRPPKPRVSPHRATPPSTRTQGDVTWYGIPGSVWPGGVSPHPPAVPLPGVRSKLTLSWPNPGQHWNL